MKFLKVLLYRKIFQICKVSRKFPKNFNFIKYTKYVNFVLEVKDLKFLYIFYF